MCTRPKIVNRIKIFELWDTHSCIKYKKEHVIKSPNTPVALVIGLCVCSISTLYTIKIFLSKYEYSNNSGFLFELLYHSTGMLLNVIINIKRHVFIACQCLSVSIADSRYYNVSLQNRTILRLIRCVKLYR